MNILLSLIDVYRFVELGMPECSNAIQSCVGALFKTTYVGDIKDIMAAGGPNIVQGMVPVEFLDCGNIGAHGEMAVPQPYIFCDLNRHNFRF